MLMSKMILTAGCWSSALIAGSCGVGSVWLRVSEARIRLFVAIKYQPTAMDNAIIAFKVIRLRHEPKIGSRKEWVSVSETMPPIAGPVM